MQRQVSGMHFVPGCTIFDVHLLTNDTIYIFVGKLLKGQGAVIVSSSNKPNVFK